MDASSGGNANSLVEFLDLFGLPVPVESNLPPYLFGDLSLIFKLEDDDDRFKLVGLAVGCGAGVIFFLMVTGIGAGLMGCSIYLRSPECKIFCAIWLCSAVPDSPSTITMQLVSSWPCLLDATQLYLPESDGRQPTISIVITPSEVDIEYSYLLSSRLSLYHLTVGKGLPARQQRSLQVSFSCITRGRNRKVKLGAHSCSSCQ